MGVDGYQTVRERRPRHRLANDQVDTGGAGRPGGNDRDAVELATQRRYAVEVDRQDVFEDGTLRAVQRARGDRDRGHVPIMQAD